MKQSVAKTWIRALRSGKYKQTHGKLYSGRGYCCLGVLCKVMGKDFTKDNDNGGYWRVEGTDESVALPENVRKMAGMKTKTGEYIDYVREGIGIGTSLANQNDEGKRFKTIAKIIEQRWQDL